MAQHMNGQCLCGTVQFSVPKTSQFLACHCSECRRWHGTSPVGIDSTIVTLLAGKDILRWFRSSEQAERGFCTICGSSLFYRLRTHPDRWSVYSGALENIPANARVVSQFFTHEKPSAYTIK